MEKGELATAEHEHHSHPSRCCPEEPAEDVLKRLMANPPDRRGYKTPHGWSGESMASFSARNAAWLQAIAREELAQREGR